MNIKNNDSTIKIKVVHRSGNGEHFLWTSQCPGNIPRWGNCEFHSLPSYRDYDWLVVIDDIPKIQPGRREIVSCPSENTIMVTTEPSTVTFYGQAFAAQFATILTNQDESALPHPNAIRSQTGNVWFHGQDYDTLKKNKNLNKPELFSTVCSSKQQAHTMHAKRYNFTQRLKKDIPELEIFGHGVRYIEKKYQALNPYRYHLVIENHIGPHVWTEKLADAFLALTIPIYYGCPNITEYFPEESLITIDLDDYEKTLEKIQAVIYTEGEYERRLMAVHKARDLILDTYNFPAMIHNIVNAPKKGTHSGSKVIYSRRLMRLASPGDLVKFLSWKTCNFIKNKGFS